MLLRRALSTQAFTPSETKALAAFTSKLLTSRLVEHDQLDTNRVKQLMCTLPTRIHNHTQGTSIGSKLSPAHTLAYFLPHSAEPSLESDGTDAAFNPPAPLLRRMWAGGSFQWSRDNSLKVGEDVSCVTTVSSAS